MIVKKALTITETVGEDEYLFFEILLKTLKLIFKIGEIIIFATPTDFFEYIVDCLFKAAKRSELLLKF